MERTYNIPVQMFCVVSTVGDMTPVRFRFESDEHIIETVKIDSILAHKETIFNGIREVQYTCQARIFEVEKMFIITYSINSHKWRLNRMLT